MTLYTLVFTASLEYARHARAVLSACVRRVLALVCGPSVNKGPIPSLSHTHTHTPLSQVSVHSLRRLSLNETMLTVSSEPGGDMCQVAAARALPKNTTPRPPPWMPDGPWPLLSAAPVLLSECIDGMCGGWRRIKVGPSDRGL